MSIWKYQELLPPIPHSPQVTLKEGETPCEEHPELAQSLAVPRLWLKREDTNPTGSHKDRSLAYWLNAHYAQGKREFVISSSGNSAISAIYYCQKLGCTLSVFLSPHLSYSKRLRLAAALDVTPEDLKATDSKPLQFDSIAVYFSDKAVSEAFRLAKEQGVPLLRGSIDDLAIPGFMTIAFELAEQVPKASQLFIPSSSGTAATGIYKGYQKLGHSPLPQFHIVQTAAVHALVDGLIEPPPAEAQSQASAITDRVAHRKQQVQALLKETGGHGWAITDKEIASVASLLDDQCLAFSPEGALALAAIKKAAQSGLVLENPVALITGR